MSRAQTPGRQPLAAGSDPPAKQIEMRLLDCWIGYEGERNAGSEEVET